MLQRFLKKCAFRFGYDFTFRKLPQFERRNRELKIPRDMEPEFVDMYERARAYTLTSIECMYAVYQAIKYIEHNNIPGDLVECGVWRGGSAMMMALSLEALGSTSREIYLYDTYAGMTRPDATDVRSRDHAEQLSRWKAFQRDGYNEWVYAPLKEVQKNMSATGYPTDKLRFVKGDVEDTIPRVMPNDIALLRLDTDWYRSTYHELVHLHPRLVSKGVLIIDDYGAYEGSRKATDEYFAETGMATYLSRIDTAARIGIKAL